MPLHLQSTQRAPQQDVVPSSHQGCRGREPLLQGEAWASADRGAQGAQDVLPLREWEGEPARAASPDLVETLKGRSDSCVTCGSWGSERLSELPSVTQLPGGDSGVEPGPPACQAPALPTFPRVVPGPSRCDPTQHLGQNLHGGKTQVTGVPSPSRGTGATAEALPCASFQDPTQKRP